MFGYRDRARDLAELVERAQGSEAGKVPDSAIRDLRGDRSQVEVAMKAKMTQAQLSRLERGERSLTRETAKRLAPVLGVSVEELELAEGISALQRVAIKGSLSPHALLETILEMSAAMPDNEVGNDLIKALLAVLGRAVEAYSDQDEGEVSSGKAALKSGARKRPDRDEFGRRRNKPYRPTI